MQTRNSLSTYPFTKTKISLAEKIFKFICLLPKKEVSDPSSLIANSYYDIDQDENRAISIIPLLLRGILNNHTQGLKGVSFDKTNELLIMNIIENDTTISLTLNLNKEVKQEIIYHQDRYQVVTTAKFAYDEDNNLVLKVNAYFTEFPNIRLIKIKFINDTIKMEFDEQPGLAYIEKSFSKIDMNTIEIKFLQLFNNNLDLTYIKYRIKDVLNPTIIGQKQIKEDVA